MRYTVAFTAMVAAATVVALAAPAVADGGYYSGALGARAAGRSGAFVARADDPTAVSYNPAGLAKIEGTVIMVGDRISYNAYAFTRAPTRLEPTVPFSEVRNGTPWQELEPLLAVASKLGLRDWGFALAAFAAPGASREAFPISGGQRYMMVGREAIILDYAASAAWKHRDVFGVGATLEWISVPRLNYSLIIDGTPFAGVANPTSSPLDMLASTTGSDPFTFNAIVGAWVRPAPFLELALAGQVVPASIVTNSKLSVTPLDTSMGTLVLARDGIPANDVTVTLPLPLMVRAGGRYRHLVPGRDGVRELYDVELDVEYETWSRAKQFTLDTHDLVAGFQGTMRDLGKIAIPKQWRDTISVKVGSDYAMIPDRWTLRGGLFYETAVADAAYANVDFPGGQMLGGSLGSSVVVGRWEVALAYQLRHQPSFSVSEADARVYQQVPASACQPPYTDMTRCNPNYLGQPSPAVNSGTYGATSHYLAIALLYRH